MSIVTKLMTSAILCAGISTGASAATEWILATGLPDSSFFSQNYKVFIEEVEAKSGGELKIRYAGNGSLVKRDAIRRAIQTGQIQMGEVDFVNLGNEDPVFRLDSLPAFASSYDDAWRLMEAQKPYVDKLFAERGLKIVGFTPWPGQGFYSKKPITSLGDAKGVKLRIYSQPTKTMAQILGFDPIILPGSEVTQAFATGMIDAMFTSPSFGATVMQAWDYTDHHLFVGAMHSKQSLVVNEAAYQALSPKLQNVVLEAGKQVTERGWKMSEEDNAKALKTFEKHGMTVRYAWPELEKKLEDVGKALIEEWKKEASPGAMAVVEKYYMSGKK